MLKNIIATSLTVVASLSIPTKVLAGECYNAKATFYSDYYQGLTTSSGETFYQEDFTAAVPSWMPYGDYQVTNRANGRSIIVKANDTLGYGTDIDLTTSAFSSIGDLESGRLDVRICPL